MKNQEEVNPEKSWKELIEQVGDNHAPLGPTLSNGFCRDSYKLMWYAGWFKFAAKMVGKGGKTLVYDPLEGLGGWIVAKEAGDVLAVLEDKDSIDSVRSAWPDEKITFLQGILNAGDNEFSGMVCFDIDSQMNKAGWNDFFKQAGRCVIEGGVVVAGGMSEGLGGLLKEEASRKFENIFVFGKGQPHPCISPADAVVIVAC